MKAGFYGVRGMADRIGEEIGLWQWIETETAQLLNASGYREWRLPILEETGLFLQAIGAVTDVVEKEMYTFNDKKGDSLTLRPEGTAGCVRAGIEQGAFHRNQQQRLWYMGPMFRYERPQKGRYRQFHQLGIEAFGFKGPDIDVEIISLLERLWDRLGISHLVTLHINAIGTVDSRNRYSKALADYFSTYRNELDQEHQKRLDRNPFRLLDSKHSDIKKLLVGAPRLVEYLDVEELAHFEAFCQFLHAVGIRYTHDPYLVRGLDYYNGVVFEWITDALGAQGTVCGGGRYDQLCEMLGGAAVAGVGCAIGMERLALLVELSSKPLPSDRADVYIISSDETMVRAKGLLIADTIRKQLPHLRVVFHCGTGNFKVQLKKAYQAKSRIALIVGSDEVNSNQISCKWLNSAAEATQTLIPEAALIAWLQSVPAAVVE